MPTLNRLTEVYQSAKVIEFSDADKFILFSDCHRGDNSWCDDFAHNQMVYFHALNYYMKEGFTYIELGDGDELWENKEYGDIIEAHSHVFWLLNQFHTFEKERIFFVHGNHDIERRDYDQMEKSLKKYYNDLIERGRPKEWVLNLIDVPVHEGLRLKYTLTGQTFFLVHGHQDDFFNDHLWKVGRFFVCHLWRHLQLLGIHDPTSPAKNFIKMNIVERKLKGWVESQIKLHGEQVILIAGHTHRSRFPRIEELPYFNTGSCVHPRCITGIEIQNGELSLIKWWLTVTTVRNDRGIISIAKEILAGPQKINKLAYGR